MKKINTDELEFIIKTPVEKKTSGILPYLTFPLTNSCNNQCIFCGEGGELTAEDQDRYFDTAILVDRSLTANKMGITKFRLTGGEPFIHPGIHNILKFFSDQQSYLLVNTNGNKILKHKGDFVELNDNVHVAVSLHTTKEAIYNKITGTSNQFKKVISGIEFLRDIGNLLRLNMVVTKYNRTDVDNMIQYCNKLGCGLKLHEIVDVPKPFGERESILVPLHSIEIELARRAEKILTHEYSESFGIPCRKYIIDGVTINVKSLGHGSRYDLEELCNGCKYLPCHEGLYDCYVLPDGNLLPCRWGKDF